MVGENGVDIRSLVSSSTRNRIQRRGGVRWLKSKAIAALVVALFLLGIVAIAVPVNATTTKFNGLTYFAKVTIQTEADALPSDINALGFDIGVLVDGNGIVVNERIVHDATQFGIAVDGSSSVDVTGCEIYNIGFHSGSAFAPNGMQYRNAIYYCYSSGVVSGNNVHTYQKGGIISNYPFGGEILCVQDNTVNGLGPVSFIAQNGIQIGYEQKAVVTGNAVSNNYYVDVTVSPKGKAIGQQTWVSCGILMYSVHPNECEVSQNILRGNQVQIYMYPA